MTDTKLDWHHGNGLPGGGPWRVLADCPSRLHNTYNSARGGSRRPNPCVCPHALAELAAKREQERAKRDYSREAQLLRKRRKQQAPTYLKSSPAPRTWFPEARCQTPGGRRILLQPHAVDERRARGGRRRGGSADVRLLSGIRAMPGDGARPGATGRRMGRFLCGADEDRAIQDVEAGAWEIR